MNNAFEKLEILLGGLEYHYDKLEDKEAKGPHLPIARKIWQEVKAIADSERKRITSEYKVGDSVEEDDDADKDEE